MHAHLSGDVSKDFVSVFEHHAERGIRQAFLDHTVNFNSRFFGRRLLR